MPKGQGRSGKSRRTDKGFDEAGCSGIEDGAPKDVQMPKMEPPKSSKMPKMEFPKELPKAPKDAKKPARPPAVAAESRRFEGHG